MNKKFLSSYQGEIDWDIDGRIYHQRVQAEDYGYYNPGVYDNEILPRVGTVWSDWDGEYSYPSQEIMALFPGYIPSMWDSEAGCVRYPDGMKPDVIVLTRRSER